MPSRAKLPPGEGKRVPLNMRTTQETRDRLAKAAADSGRSLVQEVECRLEHSFLDEDARSREMGGKELQALFRLLGAAAEMIEARTGKKRSEDWYTANAVNSAWQELLATAMPKPPREVTEATRRVQEEGQSEPNASTVAEQIGGGLSKKLSADKFRRYQDLRSRFDKRGSVAAEDDELMNEVKTAIEEMGALHESGHVFAKFEAAVQMGQKAVRDLLPEKGGLGPSVPSKRGQRARKAKSTATKRN